MSALSTACYLAHEKAKKISNIHPNRMVIGADQVLECDNMWFEKPHNIAMARNTLNLLRNKTHTLFAGVSAAFDGKIVWSTCDQAELTMRDFSDDFLNQYIKTEGAKILSSVGAYRIEEQGLQLFSKINGDYFTVLGLPVMVLLEFLRCEGFLRY